MSTEYGRKAEDLAAAFLRLRGLEILDRNRRAGGGELDLIAREGLVLVFVEVRLRSAGAWVDAAGSINAAKLRRLRACAAALRRAGRLPFWPGQRFRFDAVLLDEDASNGAGMRLRHFQQIDR